jgi:methylmalonyl-CoA mutase, C-terminal domain
MKILLTKPTQDCHDRGVRYVARVFRDAGFEVIFTNFLLTAEIVATAVQEDVAAIGVSSSSGGHMAVFEDLLGGMQQAGLDDVLVIGGGVIPAADVRNLNDRGIQVFGPGSSADDAVEYVRQHIRPDPGW